MSKTIKKVIKEETIELPPMKVIEPFQAEVQEFETKEDFIKFINEGDNNETYKQLTTQKLNKMFDVHGYKITKLKGEISLRSIKKANDPSELLRELKDDIKNQEEVIQKQEETITSLQSQLKDHEDALKKVDINIDAIMKFLEQLETKF